MTSETALEVVSASYCASVVVWSRESQLYGNLSGKGGLG